MLWGAGYYETLCTLWIDIIFEEIWVTIAIQPELEPTKEVLALAAGACSYITEVPHLTSWLARCDELVSITAALVQQEHALVASR